MLLRCPVTVKVVGVAFVLTLAFAARADVVAWNEAVNGEFSKNELAPTPVGFISGGNDVLGTDGPSGPGFANVDPDYFTFTVPAGLALTAIAVLPGTTSAGIDNVSFIGIQSGTQITHVMTSPPSAAGLLGWWHFGPGDIGTDILPEMGIPADGSSGFTPPLGAGDYAIWIQEADLGGCSPLCHYGFDFVLAPVPEPASSTGLLTGLALLAALRRHRRSRSPATEQVTVEALGSSLRS
jgi:hypothetical protein